nr:uncharacterized protein LOC109147843 [Ipomoea batatas]
MEYIRVRVYMDTTSPLRQRIKLKNAAGEVLSMECKCERLPTFCFICGLIGHSEKFCIKQFNSMEIEERMYGPELRAVIWRKNIQDYRWLLSQQPDQSTTLENNPATEDNLNHQQTGKPS